jgi:hypothetical protein
MMNQIAMDPGVADETGLFSARFWGVDPITVIPDSNRNKTTMIKF